MKLENIILDKERLFRKENLSKEDKDLENVFALALVKSHDEVVNLVKYANENDLIIIPRGANTGVAGSQTPILGNELIIDFKLMNNIIELDKETQTLTVEPGVLLGNIHDYTEKLGFFYPPDPASKHSSIGGNVATNAGGLRAVKYGVTRDYIKEIDVVLASGESITLGSLNIKNSSGYNLLHLFVGSEGTLGITTKIKLKLLPFPKVKKSMIIAFANVEAASNATLKILLSESNPSEIELFERDAIVYAEKYLNYQLKSTKGNAYLLIEVDGNNEADVLTQLDIIKDVTKDLSIETIFLTSKKDIKQTKALRDNILIGLMEYTEYEMLDEVVPINNFSKLIAYTKTLEKKYNIKVLNFGHAGDGNVHTVLLKNNNKNFKENRKKLLDDLYNKVSKIKGLPSAEHGIGLYKRDYFIKMTDDNNLKYMREIKKVFDPKNILNPKKIF